jgi:hypothetical protein
MKNIVETLRQKGSTLSLRFVSAPYLPADLIGAALLLAYTDWMLVLLGQPAGYWIDRGRSASDFGVLRNLLAAGVFPYLLVGSLYLLLLWALLTILTRSFALVLWLPVSFLHLNHILTWSLDKSKLTGGAAVQPLAETGVSAISVLLLGILLVSVLIKRPQAHKEQNRWRRWIRPVVLGAWVLGLILAVSLSAIWPRGGWTQIHPGHTPGVRASSAIAYDSARQRTVLFGGISDWIGSTFYHERDTWEWDGNDWIEMNPKTVPPSRAGQMMAYDEKRGVVVMFGGEDKSGNYMLADTWIWDGKDWGQMSPTGYPSARRGGQMFYDPQTEKVILTGGFYYGPEKVFTPVNDTWAWDGKDWEFVANAPENLIITNPNVAYDPVQKRTILFDYKQVMTWTDNYWQKVQTGFMPPSRFGTWLAADPANGTMLIFGGVDNSVQLNDTWMFEGGTWKELHPDLTPAPRDAHIMFFDPTRNSFILYGGISTYTLDDMWEYVLP